MTYLEEIGTLETDWSDNLCAVVISKEAAEDIVFESDIEIANLKRLLSVCQAALLSTGYDLFDNEIKKALNND